MDTNTKHSFWNQWYWKMRMVYTLIQMRRPTVSIWESDEPNPWVIDTGYCLDKMDDEPK